MAAIWRRRWVFQAVVIAVLVTGATAFTLYNHHTKLDASEDQYATLPVDLLIQLKDGVSKSKRGQLFRKYQLTEKSYDAKLKFYRVSYPYGTNAANFAKELSTLEPSLVIFASPDNIRGFDMTPNDTNYANSWALPKIKADLAWDKETGTGVKIAILDTGTDCTHLDIATKCVDNYNTYDNNTNSDDIYGHGTAVAGTAAAIGNNSRNSLGVAFASQIIPVRISDLAGYAYSSTAANGVVYAADHGAKCINISYGFGYDNIVGGAADYAASKGAVVIISAGNQNTHMANLPMSPVIVVGSVNSSDAKSGFSNYGPGVDLMAPGESIYTTNRGGGMGYWSGTSFSAPIITGVCALIKGANPNATFDDVKTFLTSTAVDLGTTGKDDTFSWGRVDAQAAVQAALDALPQTPPPPPPDTTPPVIPPIDESQKIDVPVPQPAPIPAPVTKPKTTTKKTTTNPTPAPTTPIANKTDSGGVSIDKNWNEFNNLVPTFTGNTLPNTDLQAIIEPLHKIYNITADSDGRFLFTTGELPDGTYQLYMWVKSDLASEPLTKAYEFKVNHQNLLPIWAITMISIFSGLAAAAAGLYSCRFAGNFLAHMKYFRN